MLENFFRHTRNHESQANNLQEESQQAIDSLYNLVLFLQDRNSFYHPDLNKLIAAVFPSNGNYPLEIQIVTGIDTLELVYNALSPYKSAGARIMVPLQFSTQVKNNPIEGLKDVVRVASFAQDILCYRYEVDREDRPSIQRSQAYQADLLHTLNEMAETEEFPIMFTEHDKELMERFSAGIQSLPELSRPDSIDFLMRPQIKPDLN